MIIRFENIDNPSYSAEFVFGSAGFERAQYDFSDFVDVTDPDLNDINDPFSQFLLKVFNNVYTKDFVKLIFNNPFPPSNISTEYALWNSYKLHQNIGSHYFYRYNEGFDIWNGSGGICDFSASETQVFSNNCPDNLYSGFVTDSWTSAKCLKQSSINNTGFNDSVNYKYFWDNFSYNGDMNYIYKGSLPTISFYQPNISYPKFRIFAYDFSQFESSDCKYGLFLHFVQSSNNGNSIFKTLKVGCFGVYQGNFYYENFYGNKVFISDLNKRYFDFYDFFNTNTLNNLSDFLKDNFSDFSPIDINSFGMTFVFELKKEDYSGVYMSTLDCECLNEIKFALNDIALNTAHLNDLAISLDTISNTLDGTLYGCENVGLATLFSRAFNLDNCLGSVFRNECNKPLGVMFGHAFNDDCSSNYLGSVFKGDMLLEDEMGIASILSYLFSEPYSMGRRTIFVDDTGKSVFKNNCNLGIADSFTEAFNLTNECKGSVFKANDNIWNGEDSLSGIWYKQLDFNYLDNNRSKNSAFYTNVAVNYNGSALPRSFPYLFRLLGFKNDYLGDSGLNSVFKFSSGISITDILKRIFFVSTNTFTPNREDSVFFWDSSQNNNRLKILNHSCSVNPNSIKFCEDVPFDFSGFPTPQVTVNNNVPVPDVDNNITVTPSTLDFSWDGFINGFVNPFFRRFSDDQDSLLNMLKNALFCQFKASGTGNVGWNFSVFKKLLYSEDSEDCSEKVGFPELDLFVAPDNIYINSDGKPTRYTVDEVFK